MKILRAQHLGMCFGVRDAIALTRQRAALGPVTVLGDLVHNETVLMSLRRDGVRFETDPAALPTRDVIITAHGASEQRRAAVRALGFTVLEATCPLVHRAHQALAELVAQGFHPVVIGQRDHVEVRGLTEDYPDCEVVLSADDVARLAPREHFGVVSQTTQPVARVRELVGQIRGRFPQATVRWLDTVCRPTKDRQTAAEELARDCDVVVVIGGAHSNNTRELVTVCARHCARVHHIQTAVELRPEWFRPTDTIGLTAGTSTPDETIDRVHQQLHELARTAVSESQLESAGK